MKLFCTLLLAALLFISGCDASSKATDEESCTETNIAYVSEVTGDSAVAVGDKLELSVSFPVNNGCGQFNAFTETEDGNVITIEVEAIYDTCSMCTMDIPTRTATYTFQAETEGSYTLKFKSSETEFITKTITVN